MRSRNWPSERARPPNRNRLTANNKPIIRQLTAEGETGAPPLRGRDKPGRLGARCWIQLAEQTSLLTRLSFGSGRTNWGLKDTEAWRGMKGALPLGVEEGMGEAWGEEGREEGLRDREGRQPEREREVGRLGRMELPQQTRGKPYELCTSA